MPVVARKQCDCSDWLSFAPKIKLLCFTPVRAAQAVAESKSAKPQPSVSPEPMGPYPTTKQPNMARQRKPPPRMATRFRSLTRQQRPMDRKQGRSRNHGQAPYPPLILTVRLEGRGRLSSGILRDPLSYLTWLDKNGGETPIRLAPQPGCP